MLLLGLVTVTLIQGILAALPPVYLRSANIDNQLSIQVNCTFYLTHLSSVNATESGLVSASNTYAFAGKQMTSGDASTWYTIDTFAFFNSGGKEILTVTQPFNGVNNSNGDNFVIDLTLSAADVSGGKRKVTLKSQKTGTVLAEKDVDSALLSGAAILRYNGIFVTIGALFLSLII